jgi:cobalamin biosynthesis protein CobW
VAAGRFAEDPEAVQRQRAADTSLDHDNPLEEVFEDQLLCADLVILNKSDLLSEPDRTAVADQVGKVLPRSVKLIEAENGRVPIDVLLGLGAGAESDLDARPSHHDQDGEHDHDDFETFIIDLPVFRSPQALVERLGRVAELHDVLRMKGFADIDGKPIRLLVQAVGGRIQHQFDRRWLDGERQGRLVVIGENGLDRDAIRSLILG